MIKNRMKTRWIAVVALGMAACGPKAATTGGTTTPDNTTDTTDTTGTDTTDTTPAEVDTSMCAGADGMGPIMLTDEQAAGRYGLGAHSFAEVPSTQEHPIEVCGVGNELEWLKTVTCADGSNPWPGNANPDNDRTGSVGEGGRCGMIIDLYPAQCPEETYQVYMDMYFCASNENFM